MFANIMHAQRSVQQHEKFAANETTLLNQYANRAESKAAQVLHSAEMLFVFFVSPLPPTNDPLKHSTAASLLRRLTLVYMLFSRTQCTYTHKEKTLH